MSEPSYGIEQAVRDQVGAEGPQFDRAVNPAEAYEAYVDDMLENMSRAEFLRRISEALDKQLPAALAAQ